MDFTVIFGEIAGQLNTDKGSRQVGDLEGAGDGVVVGDGHIVHPHFPGGGIDELRRGVAFRAVEFT